MISVDVRHSLVEALKLDLVGPENGSDLEEEVLNQGPSRWYLTGFLVPLEASESQRSDETADEEVDGGADEAGGTDDTREPEKPAARRRCSLPRWAESAHRPGNEAAQGPGSLGRLQPGIRRGRHETHRGRASDSTSWSDPANPSKAL